MRPPKNSVYFSVSCQKEEKDALDNAAKDAGKTRNRFVRDWIESLRNRPKEPSP